jgi:hypothetical protein
MPGRKKERMRSEKREEAPKHAAAEAAGKPARPKPRKRRGPFRRLLPFLIVLFLLAVFLFAPFAAGMRAAVVIPVYDYFCERESLPQKLGLNVRMPLKNMDFNPVLITYNDDAGMSSWLGEPVSFTVDYAVAGFGFLSGHSYFYDKEHPLYNAYAGAYYVQGLGKPADREDVLGIASFDQRCLALPAIGLRTQDAVFEPVDIRKSSGPVKIAGYEWDRYDAVIKTNGPEHYRKSFHSGYVLFGDPPPSAEDYPLRETAGRIYVTYIKDLDLTVGLYILAKDASVVEEIDRKVVSGTQLIFAK